MNVLQVVLLILVTASPGGERAKLEWNLKEGDVFFVEQTILRKESLETKGKAFRQTSTLTKNLSFTVKEKTATGTVLVQKIEAVKHKGEIGPASEGAGSLADKMTGGTFTLTLNPAGRIARFEGYDAFIKKIGDGNVDFEKTARVLLPEDAVRHTSDELWSFLPPRPVAKGDQWRRETPFPLGPLGSFKAFHVYTLDAPDKEGEIVLATGSLIFIPPPPSTAAFRISKVQLKAEPATGRYVFDAKLGRLIQATSSVSIKGHVTIDITGTQAEMDLAMEQTTTIRVLDKNPQEKE